MDDGNAYSWQATVDECRAACMELPICSGVVTSRTAVGVCYRRADVAVESCEYSEHYDLHVVPRLPMPTLPPRPPPHAPSPPGPPSPPAQPIFSVHDTTLVIPFYERDLCKTKYTVHSAAVVRPSPSNIAHTSASSFAVLLNAQPPLPDPLARLASAVPAARSASLP